jgi:hypothetical protein
MVLYVALIALLNLGLGYALAVYLGAGRSQLVTTIGDPLDSIDDSESGIDN